MDQSSLELANRRVVPATSKTLRDVSGVLFRQRRLMTISFVCVFAGAIVAYLLLGIQYEANTKILVKHRRSSDTVSAGSGEVSDQGGAGDLPTEREINTEITLLQSQDLLENVARDSGLTVPGPRHWWNSWRSPQPENVRLAKAVQGLRGELRVSEIPQSNVISVSYRSASAQTAARVLGELDRLYLLKHLQVNRPPGVFDFFQQQAQRYQQELAQAEAKLASFDVNQNSVNPDLEKEIFLRKANDFDATWNETRSQIQETEKRVRTLLDEVEKTPERHPTQVTMGDNSQLMATLKSNLQELENKRTDLVSKYAPSYRLVQDVDQQIADVRATISAESSKPVHQESTDLNPTYELLQAELVRANADLAALRAKADATAPVARKYGEQALAVDKTGLDRQDLIRNVKATESNYLLYLQKGEQARISDALDNSRILNVAIAEPPTPPLLPFLPPMVVVLAGAALALMFSIGSAFIADYTDSTFRSPDEVAAFLDVPVLASFPLSGHPPRMALSPSPYRASLPAAGEPQHNSLAPDAESN